jgi:hypothetical protein
MESIDVEMLTVWEWSFPEQMLSVSEIEDDESSLTISHHVIDTDKVIKVAVDLFNGDKVDSELLSKRSLWLTHLKEAIADIEGEPKMTLNETIDAVREWVNGELQPSIDSYATERFESYKDGSEWENYYD